MMDLPTFHHSKLRLSVNTLRIARQPIASPDYSWTEEGTTHCSLYSRFLNTQWRLCDVLSDFVDIPETGEFQRPGAMAIRLIYVQQ